ncbi:hypothetical protein MBLNU457_6300t1 [Dothideomycetes sp. NU457]
MARATRQRKSAPVEVPEPEPEEVQEEEEEVQDDGDEEMVDVEEEGGEVEEEQEEEGTVTLKFDEPLTWKAGKQIIVSELLRRLKKLHKELSDIEQEDAYKESFHPVAKELANVNLLNHKDKGVKAWVAACLVEIFRILAPNAPYNQSQLKEIFSLFITSTIPALANPMDPYNDQHLRVLTSLDEVKSIVLLTDIQGSESLLVKLFLSCFDILSDSTKNDSEEMLSKNVEYHMTRMLVTVVDEAASIPSGVVDMILAQFLRTDPSIFPSHTNKGASNGDSDTPAEIQQLPPAYNMAKNICTTCADKMSRVISQYFATIITDATEGKSLSKTKKATGKRRRGSEEAENDDNIRVGPSEEDIKELAKVHKLLRELWRSASEVVSVIMPQLEAELAAENVTLRSLALETVGDMISGIGAAGPPPPAHLDPAAYPSQSLQSYTPKPTSFNFLTTPAAPGSFLSRQPQTYQAFMNRRSDGSSQVRALWTTCAGRILSTSGGGVGLDQEEEENLLSYMTDMLQDSDEKVRLAMVQAIGRCDLQTIVQHIGANGGVNDHGSILFYLVDKLRDRKISVRSEAMEILARLWGVASGAMAEGNDRMKSLLGPIASNLLGLRYINEPETNYLLQKVFFDSLLPLNFPPSKSKSTKGNSQRVKDSQATQSQRESEPDVDAIRAERILLLTSCLDERSKAVFFSLQMRQAQRARYMEVFLKCCEEYNGGVNIKGGKGKKDKDNTELSAEARLRKVIAGLVDPTHYSDTMTVNDHLFKFAKKHDRRCYHLIRLAMDPASDFKKVTRAIKEAVDRVDASIASSLYHIVTGCSVLVYNKSHIPTVLEYSRTDDKGLGGVAHEILKDMSERHPEVFKAHVRTMCEILVGQAPKSSSDVSDDGTVQTLKACAGFAQRFPDEIPKERNFLEAMFQFATISSSPQAAKHAVTVIASIDDKKDMYLKNIINESLKEFKFGEDGYLTKLAALSQLMLVAAGDIEDQHDDIIGLAIQNVLLQQRITSSGDEADWREDLDEDTSAKIWALKILVNRLRYYANAVSSEEMQTTVKEMASGPYTLLRTLIKKEGEMGKGEGTTPSYQKSRLRLTAAKLLVKLCGASKHLDHLLTHADFNQLALVTQDAVAEVRSGFVTAIQKNIALERLPNRFYAILFLLAFEPNKATQEKTAAWLKSQSIRHTKKHDTVLELCFARFISLLAHHPDFSMEVENLKDFVAYIMFYLKIVAQKSTISLIYNVAQRVKSVQDGIDPEMSDNLYCLSDIAQAVVRAFADEKGWQLPAFDGKITMPSGIFALIKGHGVSQAIAEKQYAPEDLLDGIEDAVRISLHPRKRKADHVSTNQAKKKSKPSEPRAARATPAKKAAKRTPKKPTGDYEDDEEGATMLASERRRSSRKSNAKSYAGMADSDDEDEDEDQDGGAEDEPIEVEGDEAEDEDEAEEGGEEQADGDGVEEEEAQDEEMEDAGPADEDEAPEEGAVEEEVETPAKPAKKGKKAAKSDTIKVAPAANTRSTRSRR